MLYEYKYHAHVLSALSLRRPDVSRSLSALFRVRYWGYVCWSFIPFWQTAQYYSVQQLLIGTYCCCVFCRSYVATTINTAVYWLFFVLLPRLPVSFFFICLVSATLLQRCCPDVWLPAFVPFMPHILSLSCRISLRMYVSRSFSALFVCRTERVPFFYFPILPNTTVLPCLMMGSVCPVHALYGPEPDEFDPFVKPHQPCTNTSVISVLALPMICTRYAPGIW